MKGGLMDRTSFLRKLLFVDAASEARRLVRGLPPHSGRSDYGAVAHKVLFTFMRPPGAWLEPVFLARCTRCDLCIEACPPGIIIRASHALMGVGTPVVDINIGPCDECGKCTDACPEGALSRSEDRRMGRAVIHQDTCLLALGQDCAKCLDACPEPGAILISSERRIAVDTNICTGCAICYAPCPTVPRSIHIEGRPPLPLSAHPRVPISPKFRDGNWKKGESDE
jgi:ferredoxin-type protein NapF